MAAEYPHTNKHRTAGKRKKNLTNPQKLEIIRRPGSVKIRGYGFIQHWLVRHL
jgi:hypothetical protein